MSGRRIKNGKCTHIKNGKCELYPEEKLVTRMGFQQCMKCAPQPEPSKKTK